MNKRTMFARSEKGQTLLIVAVVMVGLIALMGLAIDGGNLFVQRREAQNAADAAALAGTRVLAKAIHTCGGSASALDQQIAQEVNKYAEINGISDTDGNPGNAVNDNVAAQYVTGSGAVLGTVGGGAVPEGTIGVQVQVEDEHETFFITIVGISTATSSAQAKAIAGAVTALPPGIGVLPLGVHVDILNGVGYDNTFESIDISDSGSNGQFCLEDEEGNFTDCVTTSDPNSAQRGWLNLNFIYNLAALPSNATNPLNRTFEKNVSNSGCGSDPSISLDDGLAGWASLPDAEGNCAYPFPMWAGDVGGVDGDFIHGGPGARASTIDEIHQTYEGHIGVIPVFDKVYSVDYMESHFAPAQAPPGTSNGGGWPTAGGGTDAWMYHIVGFVGMMVDEMDKGADTLTGSFKESIFGTGRVSTDIHGYDPDGCDSRMFAVVLWE